MPTASFRTLRLLSLLQTRRYWPGPLLAERLGVTGRTLRRDVDRLRELGYPVDARPGVAGGYHLIPGAALPPLVVDDDEAVALAMAVQTQIATGNGGEAAVRALTKIVQVLPRRLRGRLDAIRSTTTPAPFATMTAAPVDHEVLMTVALGCRDRERIRLAYRAVNGSRTSRSVEPYHLVPLGQRWYLVAFDLDRRDWRTFRIDRIETAESTGAPYPPRTPPFEDVADFVRSQVAGGAAGGRHRVEVVFETSAEYVRDRIGGWAEVTAEGPGRCRMIMETDALDGPLFALGSLRTAFTVIAPEEFKIMAADWGARFTRATHP